MPQGVDGVRVLLDGPDHNLRGGPSGSAEGGSHQGTSACAEHHDDKRGSFACCYPLLQESEDCFLVQLVLDRVGLENLVGLGLEVVLQRLQGALQRVEVRVGELLHGVQFWKGLKEPRDISQHRSRRGCGGRGGAGACRDDGGKLAGLFGISTCVNSRVALLVLLFALLLGGWVGIVFCDDHFHLSSKESLEKGFESSGEDRKTLSVGQEGTGPKDDEADGLSEPAVQLLVAAAVGSGAQLQSYTEPRMVVTKTSEAIPGCPAAPVAVHPKR
mmetsp:Transcript_44642/g.95968  ORF Transcript_44642/g.95968 Transcript_44642/m.95968 type:complete len:272 (+) Transcript_44642:822-1637(+)